MDKGKYPEGDYSVGYKRPPRENRFCKGRSGNPKGRPKGALNLSTLIEKELEQKVTINENGERKRISKKQAIAKQLVNKAATGDHKVMPLLLNEERQRERDPSPNAISHALPKEDEHVLANLLKRIREPEPLSDPVRADGHNAQPSNPIEDGHLQQDDPQDPTP